MFGHYDIANLMTVSITAQDLSIAFCCLGARNSRICFLPRNAIPPPHWFIITRVVGNAGMGIKSLNY